MPKPLTDAFNEEQKKKSGGERTSVHAVHSTKEKKGIECADKKGPADRLNSDNSHVKTL
jgi:hypothetical protein